MDDLEESMLSSELYTFDLQKEFLNNNNKEVKNRKVLQKLFIKFSNNETKTLAVRKNDFLITLMNYGHQD